MSKETMEKRLEEIRTVSDAAAVKCLDSLMYLTTKGGIIDAEIFRDVIKNYMQCKIAYQELENMLSTLSYCEGDVNVLSWLRFLVINWLRDGADAFEVKRLLCKTANTKCTFTGILFDALYEVFTKGEEWKNKYNTREDALYNLIASSEDNSSIAQAFILSYDPFEESEERIYALAISKLTDEKILTSLFESLNPTVRERHAYNHYRENYFKDKVLKILEKIEENSRKESFSLPDGADQNYLEKMLLSDFGKVDSSSRDIVFDALTDEERIVKCAIALGDPFIRKAYYQVESPELLLELYDATKDTYLKFCIIVWLKNKNFN